MQVKIGPYPDYWGPYQIAERVFGNPDKYVADGDQTWRHRWSERLGDYLAKTWIANVCNWINNHRQRQQYVRIDYYDTWSMDETLRIIIAPMLKQLQATKHGSANIDDADVPLELRSTQTPPLPNSWDTDANFHQRYSWLLGELIWVFATDHDAAQEAFWDRTDVDLNQGVMEQVQQTKADWPQIAAYQARIDNAYRLFGKYYRTLWD